MVSVSAFGSWPGRDVAEALRTVRGEIADLAGDDVAGIPYLPTLPARGAASTLIARTAGVLVDLSIDLQPQGWRLVDRPGRDLTRIGSARGEDLDYLAEIFHGWTGPFIVQAYGPWSLAADLWLPRGDRVLADRGAMRDLFGSLTEGLIAYLGRVGDVIPGADLTLLLHEPRLPAVLGGTVRSDSGLKALPQPDASEATGALRTLGDAIHGAGHATGIRAPGSTGTLKVTTGAGPDVLSVSTGALDDAGWELVAPFVESDGRLWAGVIPVTGESPPPGAARDAAAGLADAWHRVGLEQRRLSEITLTPTDGLGDLPLDAARRTLATTTDAARILTERLAN